MPEKHLTQDELADCWKISAGTLQNWRYLGCGPKFLKLNGGIRYRQEDVEEYERKSLCIATGEKVYRGAMA